MKDKKILFGTFIILLLILTTGLSYAYFSVSVKGNDNAKNTVVETGTLKLVYTDSPEIVAEHIKPGWTTTKVVTVKNTGTLDTAYNLVWQELTNEITNDEMIISATCERLNSSNSVEGTCESITESPAVSNKIKKNISIESGITHKYTFTITFKEINSSQDYNQNKKFNGVIGVEEYKLVKVAGTLKQLFFSESGITDESLVRTLSFYSDGREIKDTQFYDVSEEQNDSIKMYVKQNSENNSLYNLIIVGDGIIYLPSNSAGLFSFYKTQYGIVSNINKIEFNDSINTSKVTDMSSMFFHDVNLNELDLNIFDTSNVTNMFNMFYNCSSLKTIYVSNKFVTDNVTTSDNMFTTINIIGGNGTVYDSTKTDKTYARIDGGTSNPGYFTAK